MVERDRISELLGKRELRSLRLLAGVRVALIAVMLPVSIVVSFSGFERTVVSSVLLVYAAIAGYSLILLRARKRLMLVGLMGAGLDITLLAVLSVIWYLSVGGSAVAAAFTLKTAFPEMALLFITLNSLAMRPLYPLLVTIGAIAVHLALFAYAVGDERTILTADYLEHAMGPALAIGRVVATAVILAAAGTVLTVLTAATRKIVFEAVRLEAAKTQLGRYFSPNLVERLLDNPALLNLGGERRTLSFVFTDLAGFTSLAEHLSPEVITPLLNEYLNGMTHIAFNHEGTIDKIVGDAVLVMFGAPMEQPDQAARAVACALNMDVFAQAFADRQRKQGIPLGMTRIGVHSGLATVGNFGGEAFFDYTAYGDAVNTTARLEGANKYLDTRICVSDKVISQIPDFKGRPIGTLVLKGKSQGLRVFEPLSGEQAASQATQAYLSAFEMLENGTSDACSAFAALAKAYPGDSLVAFHLKRLQAGESGTTIVMAEK